MTNDRDLYDNIVEHPAVAGRTRQLRALDMFTKDVLTRVIGFDNGSLELARAGYRWIGNIAAAKRADLEHVQGMTPWKLRRIEGFLRRHGLTFEMDTREWQQIRERIDALPSPDDEIAICQRRSNFPSAGRSNSTSRLNV